MLGYDFNTVRVLCNACGWFRNIGYTGLKGSVRAVIRIQRAKDPTHILHGKVLELPADKPMDEVAETCPGFRDLEAEAYRKGLFAAMAEFDALLADAICPRCKKGGRLCLSSIKEPGREIKY